VFVYSNLHLVFLFIFRKQTGPYINISKSNSASLFVLKIYYFYRMKNLLVLLLFSIAMASCQSFDDYAMEIDAERVKKDSSFLIADKSPLSVEQIERFIGLEYFPIEKKYLVSRMDSQRNRSILHRLSFA